MLKHPFALLLALLGVLLILETAAADSPTVGMILPLTGPAAPFGAIVKRGVDRAVSPAHRLTVEDDACDPAKAISAFRSLRQRGSRLFLGPCCTTSMTAIAPIIKKEGLLAMNVCTGSERAWGLSGQRIFHSQMSAEEESRQNAEMMWTRGIRSVVLLYAEQEYALAHERTFRDAFKGDVVQSLSFSGSDSGQVKSLVLKLKSLKFDALYIPIMEPFLLGVLTQAAKIGAKPPNVFSVFSFELPEVLAMEGVNAEGVIYSYPDIPSDQPAAEYFAGTGAQLFMDAVNKCADDTDCALQETIKSNRFDAKGFLKGKFMWKTVLGGKFVNLSARPQGEN